MSNLRKLLFVFCTINLAVTNVRTDWLTRCGPCRCKWNSGKKTADCKNASLNRVPIDMSTELQVLDLSSNPIPEIQNSEFAAADLRNLHKLFMRNCTLKSMTRDSLKGLEILIELDLSYNLIKSLPRGAFGNLVKLRALMLNNNRIERLDDGLFRNLKFLHKIELKENLIVRIEMKAFTNLPVLSQIYLDSNQLKVLRRETFDNLEKLTSLSLKLNPWNCTCELKPFRDFTFQHNLYTPPTDCYYPESLRGTLWSDASPDAFACRPKILFPLRDRATVSASSDNVTLTCRIQSTSNTAVSWTYNRHALANYPKRIFIKNISESNESESKEMLTSELTIVNVRRSDEGVFTCTAKNVGGKDEMDIQLLVGRQANGLFQLTNNVMLVLCLMAISLLMVSIIIIVATCCYCRRIRNGTKPNADAGKKHFEAIKMNSFTNGTIRANGSGTITIGASNSTDATTLTNDIGKQKHAGADFIRADKSQIIETDTHEIKCVGMEDNFISSEIRHASPTVAISSSNDLVLSPQRQTFTYEQYRDTRLPPDLLPYGPQALTGQNSAAALMEQQHKNHHQYNSSAAFGSAGGDSGIGIGATITTTTTTVNITTYASGNDSTEDLRIYHHPCNGNLATGVASSTTSLLSSPKTLVSLTPSTASARSNYEYTITNNGQSGSKISPNSQQQYYQHHQQPQPPYQSMQSTTNATKIVDNGCKPRQSIVRTSPSFSFLSTGYQQQDNFL